MKRIQGQGGFAPREPYDERKKSRESVIANLFIFGSMIGVIKVCKYTVSRRDHLLI